MKLCYVCMLLVIGGSLHTASAGRPHPLPKAAPPVDPNIITPEAALAMNLENAVKLYLHDRGVLTPGDVSTNAGPQDVVRMKHGVAVHRAAPASKCIIPDGCVILPAKQRFLTNKYIPGNDNILSPYFTKRGHMYLSTSDAEVTDFDIKAYIMSRPKQAVPEAVRHLLMPEGDSAWPGGEGGDRAPYYPKTEVQGSAYWETDLDPGFGISRRPHDKL